MRGQERDLLLSQAHYVRNVLRAVVGARLALFDGVHGEWEAQIIDIGKHTVMVRVGAQSRTQMIMSDLWLCFAPIKRTRLDYVAQKATEMGVSRILPVLTARTQNLKLNLARLRANAIEAAEQCGILSVPSIDSAQKLSTLLTDWVERVPHRMLIYCDEVLASSSDAHPDIDSLARLRGHPRALLVGPEGGFTDEERAVLQAHPHAQALALGARVLRADTAIVAALTLIQTHSGDWGMAGECETDDAITPSLS